MAEYRLTPSAKSDLIEIWNYTVETWGEQVVILISLAFYMGKWILIKI